MDLYPLDILLHIVNLIVLFILLRLILWKPLYRYLEARAENVQGELKSAENFRREAEELKAGYASELENIEAKGREIVRDSQLKASQEAQNIINDAHNQAQSVINEAREKIDGEKAQAVASARNEIAQLATDLAARILKREVSATDNKSIIDEFFGEAE